MDDCIYRQAVIDAVCDLPTWYGDAGCLPFGDPQPPMEALLYPEDVVSAINNLPSADVAPVRHGRWINHGSFEVCSFCGEEQYGHDSGRYYCPNCGARMEGEE